MLLKQIRLKNFRNYKDNFFQFNPFITVIIGKNAVGKTNLLEGIYFGYRGSGFREKREIQLITFGEQQAMVELREWGENEQKTFQILIKIENNKTKKLFYVNQVKRNYSFYVQESGRTVLFTPQQITIISNSPEERRNYFDDLLSYFYPAYKTALINYKNALRRRNKVLENNKDFDQLKTELKFWDNFLESEGKIIVKTREDYIRFLNENPKIEDQQFFIEYKKNQFTKEKAAQFLEKELKMKQTLIGPQKDDFRIYLKEKDIHFFGSRSEQRLALFWLKISEINFFEKHFGKKPVLLLDDIFSEFDLDHQKLVLRLIKKYQTVITTTDPLILEMIDYPYSTIALTPSQR